MGIYDLLNRIIVKKRFELSANLFVDNDMDELDDKEKTIFDLLKKISSLGTKIHNAGIEFHPMFVMVDGRRTFSIEDISEEDYLELQQLQFDKIPLILRAMIADVLWVNKKDYSAAQVAANAYWELFSLWYKA